MKYPGIDLDRNNRVRACPLCDNDYILDGDYCQICGTMVVNRCTNSACEEILSGEARYCHKCGKEATFFRCGFLREWKSLKRKNDVAKLFAALDEDNDSRASLRDKPAAVKAADA